MTRRTWMRRSLLASGVTAAWPALSPAMAATPHGEDDRRWRLALVNTHTGERVDVQVAERGERSPQAQAELERLLRDHRNGELHPIDPGVVDQLLALRGLLGVDGSRPFHVISGYRSPATNASLAEAGRGVARRSLHLEGRAIDIRLPGTALRDVHRAALALGAGGVGWYERSDFVHLDTGRVRRW